MAQTLPSRSASRTQPLTPVERSLRRRLIFQDALALAALTVVSVAIAVLTYYFFHSFRDHRTVLEQRWFARGEQALATGNPAAAVEDFRSALALSTANPTYELALAEALAAANRNDEAYAYFSSLRDAAPGDGFLNLQLARLAVKRKNREQAVDFYRDALTGLWYGHGAEQRFQIRLELANYLMSGGKPTDAQGDLLTAEGNSLDHPAQLLQVAGMLEKAGDFPDAFAAYRRVERHAGATTPQVLESLLAESRLAAAMGQYKRAALAMERYFAKARQHPAASTPQEKSLAEQRLDQLQRLLQLIPFYALLPQQHAERVLMGAHIAHQRYESCASELDLPGGSGPNVSDSDAAALAKLGAQWDQLGRLKPKNLAGNAPLQDSLQTWTSDTEILTAKLCGQPTGDNELLLQLARTPDKSE